MPDGSSSGRAAASCWEVKQVAPESPDGVYWLRTNELQRPDRFYCDMTTDGGGWVLVARGREGWTFREGGQSTPENLRSAIGTPDAFAPAALPSETIDGLLDGGDVSALVDGVRLRRATAVAPGDADWQELRWSFADLTGWSWSFGGGHRLSAFSIDGVVGTGSNTQDSRIAVPGEPGDGNRSGIDRQAWYTLPFWGHDGRAGFSYAGQVGGENNDATYLWEFGEENDAIPFTQVYLRPRLTTPELEPIGDDGTPAQTQRPMVDDRPDVMAGGVLGVRLDGDSEPEVNTFVLAITTTDDRVYVGGKFDDVRNVEGELVDQNYLAAFDRATGAWIPEFRPQLDGPVYDLEIADGKLIVAGQFTQIDGAPSTSALAALDPISGAVVGDWSAALAVSGTDARPLVRTIDIESIDGTAWVYVGGNFTRITHIEADGSIIERSAGRLARVRLSDGFPDNVFLPDVDGVPFDLDALADRVHVVGKFVSVGDVARNGAATIDPVTGAVIDGLAEMQYTTDVVEKQYQQAVLAVGPNVFQGGSEHNTHVYSGSDYALLASYITSPLGGDTQALAEIGGIVYQSSHGNSFIYTDATTWPGVDGYTRIDDYQWVGAFDATTFGYDRRWVPTLRSSNSEGVWALHGDSDDCLWFGGDLIGGPALDGERQYLEGFSRFCQRDATAPSVPSNVTIEARCGEGNRITWSAATDDRAGAVRYEVLRNDRVISDIVVGAGWTDVDGTSTDRYFVRAVDAAGNRSASTPAVVRREPSVPSRFFGFADSEEPTAPGSLTSTISRPGIARIGWTASIDDVGVAGYRVLVDDHVVAQLPGTSSEFEFGVGNSAPELRLEAYDAAGNLSDQSDAVVVDAGGVDSEPPSAPTDLQGTVRPDGKIVVSWTASDDDGSVREYQLLRNGIELAAVPADSTLGWLSDLGVGSHFIQVRACDMAGNLSADTSPIEMVVRSGDTLPPTPPSNVDAEVRPDGLVRVTWQAATDDVAVVTYRVLRDRTEVAVVDGDAVFSDLELDAGPHSMQVVAVDAAGNESEPTAPVTVLV